MMALTTRPICVSKALIPSESKCNFYQKTTACVSPSNSSLSSVKLQAVRQDQRIRKIRRTALRPACAVSNNHASEEKEEGKLHNLSMDQLQDKSDTLTLDSIRASLIRQEDSIIFALIERAQFKHNSAAYSRNCLPVPMFDRHTSERCSFLEYYLSESEQMHGKMRRYTSPDELAFYPERLPPLVMPPLKFPKVLAENSVCINDEIMRTYLEEVVPAIAQPGDDNNYGSTCMNDVTCLQALSKRIHYGKFVAEAKFQSDREKYIPLIESQDGDAIMESLTYPAVEERVVNRVFKKTASYGQEIIDDEMMKSFDEEDEFDPVYKVQPEMVAKMYDQMIMPLTKKVQVAYLLRRLDHEQE